MIDLGAQKKVNCGTSNDTRRVAHLILRTTESRSWKSKRAGNRSSCVQNGVVYCNLKN